MFEQTLALEPLGSCVLSLHETHISAVTKHMLTFVQLVPQKCYISLLVCTHRYYDYMTTS